MIIILIINESVDYFLNNRFVLLRKIAINKNIYLFKLFFAVF